LFQYNTGKKRGDAILLIVKLLHMERDLSYNEFCNLLPLISADKRDRIGRFHHFIDKQRTLFGELLVRMEISQSLLIPNSNIEMSTDEYGKPHLVGHSDFHFNISHAGRYVVCAFSDAPVGIDIEEILPVDMKIAERFFAEREKEYIFEQTSESAQREAFYRVWTMKEAYIKREGRGLGIPLPSFDVLDIVTAYFNEIYSNSKMICHCCTSKPEKSNSILIGVDDVIRVGMLLRYSEHID
jgi:4'-phosphopantetheinyl transferase